MIKATIDRDHIAQKTNGHLKVSPSLISGLFIIKACSIMHNTVLMTIISINTENKGFYGLVDRWVDGYQGEFIGED